MIGTDVWTQNCAPMRVASPWGKTLLGIDGRNGPLGRPLGEQLMLVVVIMIFPVDSTAGSGGLLERGALGRDHRQ
jgi:hypothetical protein